MGVCSSKAKRGSPDVNDSNSSNQQQDTRFQRPTNQNRRSITYARPRDPGDNDDTLRRYDATNQTEELELGGLKIRYGYMSQRGYYPDGKFQCGWKLLFSFRIMVLASTTCHTHDTPVSTSKLSLIHSNLQHLFQNQSLQFSIEK